MGFLEESGCGGCPLEEEEKLHIKVQTMIANGVCDKEEMVVLLQTLRDVVQMNGGENATAVVRSIEACIFRYSNDSNDDETVYETVDGGQKNRITLRCCPFLPMCSWKKF